MSRKEIVLKYFEEQKETVEKRIESGIELYRKGDLEINFVSDKELPENIVIHAEQVNHEFEFGANLFMLDEFETEEKNKIYREKFSEVFNLATLPFYWNSIEPKKGEYRFEKNSPRIYRRPSIDLCLEYCKKNNIKPKAHCLNYDYMRPNWLYSATIEEHKKALENHFKVLAERYADVIPSWEVTNETFNVTFAKRAFLDKNYSQFYRQKDFNEWSFRMADRYFPNNRLIINDHLDFGCMRSLHGEFFGQRSPYYMEIERMQQFGVNHLDSIGFQYHCFFEPEREKELSITRYNPEHIFDVLDTYQKLGKKLQITEMTLSAFTDKAEDEEVQAILLEKLYSVYFSHPAMESIIYWNLVDGYASGGNIGEMSLGENKYYGGLCRFDMSEKPAYKVLKNLINNVWHTKVEVTAKNHKARFRGFYGDYKLKIFADGKEVQIDYNLSSQKTNVLTVKL